jgi:neutral ceramidase
MPAEFYAGVARADITPPVGIAHANWGAQLHERAVGVDLPLWATVLALRSGNVSVVIVDLDIGYLFDDLANETRAAIAALTGLPEDHIRLSYTHTHSGPTTTSGRSGWTSAGREMVAAYSESLPHRIAGAAWAAVRQLKPARIGAGTGRATIAVNRRFQRPEDGAVIVGRNWEGPVDHDVPVLRIEGVDGEPIAAVVNYACHPITVGPDNDLITPDYPGEVKRTVEQATGATCLFLQGSAGDVGPVRGVARNGAQEYKRLGRILGLEAARVWWEIETQPRRDRYEGTLESGAPLAIFVDELTGDRDATIRVANRTMQLPLRTLPPPKEMEAAFAQNLAELNELRQRGGDDEAVRLVTMKCKRTSMRAQLARDVQGKTHRPIDLQAITIGDEIALIAMPGEPFVEIGLAVRQGSPFPHTLFSGYSNIGWSYIPTAADYPLGGYEVEVTPFDPAAAEVIVEESLSLLNELANHKTC